MATYVVYDEFTVEPAAWYTIFNEDPSVYEIDWNYYDNWKYKDYPDGTCIPVDLPFRPNWCQRIIMKLFHKEKPMSNAREVAEDMIRKSKEIAAEGERRLKELDEPTYSIGDRFKQPGGSKYLLAATSHNTVIMVSLDSGCHWNGPRTIKEVKAITKAEFDREYGHSDLTRYWDNRKKVYTDGRYDQKEQTGKWEKYVAGSGRLRMRITEYVGRRLQLDTGSKEHTATCSKEEVKEIRDKLNEFLATESI